MSSSIINNNLYASTNLRSSLENINTRGSTLSQKVNNLSLIKKESPKKTQANGKKLPVTPSKKPIKFYNGSKSQNPKKRNRNSNVIYSTNNFLA
jgi:hypothetical protein